MIILFGKNELTFEGPGLGIIDEAESCIVKEEINGEFEVEMKYPIGGKLISQIQNGNIIYCKTAPNSEPQAFRIYSIEQPLKDFITVKGQHISYDMSGCTVGTINAVDMQDTLSQMKENLIIKNSYSDYKFSFDKSLSNVNLTKSFKTNQPYTMRALIFGDEGSVTDLYDVECKFNNREIIFYKAGERGHGSDNPVTTIAYSKNMTELTYTLDSSSMYDAIYPYYLNEQSDSTTLQDNVEDNKDFTTGYLKYKKTDASAKINNYCYYGVGWTYEQDLITFSKYDTYGERFAYVPTDSSEPIKIYVDPTYKDIYDYNFNKHIYKWSTTNGASDYWDGMLSRDKTYNEDINSSLTTMTDDTKYDSMISDDGYIQTEYGDSGNTTTTTADTLSEKLTTLKNIFGNSGLTSSSGSDFNISGIFTTLKSKGSSILTQVKENGISGVVNKFTSSISSDDGLFGSLTSSITGDTSGGGLGISFDTFDSSNLDSLLSSFTSNTTFSSMTSSFNDESGASGIKPQLYYEVYDDRKFPRGKINSYAEKYSYNWITPIEPYKTIVGFGYRYGMELSATAKARLREKYLDKTMQVVDNDICDVNPMWFYYNDGTPSHNVCYLDPNNIWSSSSNSTADIYDLKSGNKVLLYRPLGWVIWNTKSDVNDPQNTYYTYNESSKKYDVVVEKQVNKSNSDEYLYTMLADTVRSGGGLLNRTGTVRSISSTYTDPYTINIFKGYSSANNCDCDVPVALSLYCPNASDTDYKLQVYYFSYNGLSDGDYTNATNMKICFKSSNPDYLYTNMLKSSNDLYPWTYNNSSEGPNQKSAEQFLYNDVMFNLYDILEKKPGSDTYSIKDQSTDISEATNKIILIPSYGLSGIQNPTDTSIRYKVKIPDAMYDKLKVNGIKLPSQYIMCRYIYYRYTKTEGEATTYYSQIGFLPICFDTEMNTTQYIGEFRKLQLITNKTSDVDENSYILVPSTTPEDDTDDKIDAWVDSILDSYDVMQEESVSGVYNNYENVYRVSTEGVYKGKTLLLSKDYDSSTKSLIDNYHWIEVSGITDSITLKTAPINDLASDDQVKNYTSSMLDISNVENPFVIKYSNTPPKILVHVTAYDTENAYKQGTKKAESWMELDGFISGNPFNARKVYKVVDNGGYSGRYYAYIDCEGENIFLDREYIDGSLKYDDTGHTILATETENIPEKWADKYDFCYVLTYIVKTDENGSHYPNMGYSCLYTGSKAEEYTSDVKKKAQVVRLYRQIEGYNPSSTTALSSSSSINTNNLLGSNALNIDTTSLSTSSTSSSSIQNNDTKYDIIELPEKLLYLGFKNSNMEASRNHLWLEYIDKKTSVKDKIKLLNEEFKSIDDETIGYKDIPLLSNYNGEADGYINRFKNLELLKDKYPLLYVHIEKTDEDKHEFYMWQGKPYIKGWSDNMSEHPYNKQFVFNDNISVVKKNNPYGYNRPSNRYLKIEPAIGTQNLKVYHNESTGVYTYPFKKNEQVSTDGWSKLKKAIEEGTETGNEIVKLLSQTEYYKFVRSNNESDNYTNADANLKIIGEFKKCDVSSLNCRNLNTVVDLTDWNHYNITSHTDLNDLVDGANGVQLSLRTDVYYKLSSAEYSTDPSDKLYVNLPSLRSFSNEEYGWLQSDVISYMTDRSHIAYNELALEYDSGIEVLHSSLPAEFTQGTTIGISSDNPVIAEITGKNYNGDIITNMYNYVYGPATFYGMRDGLLWIVEKTYTAHYETFTPIVVDDFNDDNLYFIDLGTDESNKPILNKFYQVKVGTAFRNNQLYLYTETGYLAVPFVSMYNGNKLSVNYIRPTDPDWVDENVMIKNSSTMTTDKIIKSYMYIAANTNYQNEKATEEETPLKRYGVDNIFLVNCTNDDYKYTKATYKDEDGSITEFNYIENTDGNLRIYNYDCSDEFDNTETTPSQNDIRVKALKYIQEHNLTKVEEEFDIEFADLSAATEYDQIRALEYVELGDYVNVVHTDIDLEDRAVRVESVEYDAVSDKYTEITLSSKGKDLGDTAVTNGDSITNLANNASYTNPESVQEIVKKKITADYVEASDATFTTAQIQQLTSGSINCTGIFKANEFLINKIIANAIYADNAVLKQALISGNLEIRGKIVANNQSTLDGEAARLSTLATSYLRLGPIADDVGGQSQAKNFLGGTSGTTNLLIGFLPKYLEKIENNYNDKCEDLIEQFLNYTINRAGKPKINGERKFSDYCNTNVYISPKSSFVIDGNTDGVGEENYDNGVNDIKIYNRSVNIKSKTNGDKKSAMNLENVDLNITEGDFNFLSGSVNFNNQTVKGLKTPLEIVSLPIVSEQYDWFPISIIPDWFQYIDGESVGRRYAMLRSHNNFYVPYNFTSEIYTPRYDPIYGWQPYFGNSDKFILTDTWYTMNLAGKTETNVFENIKTFGDSDGMPYFIKHNDKCRANVFDIYGRPCNVMATDLRGFDGGKIKTNEISLFARGDNGCHRWLAYPQKAYISSITATKYSDRCHFRINIHHYATHEYDNCQYYLDGIEKYPYQQTTFGIPIDDSGSTQSILDPSLFTMPSGTNNNPLIDTSYMFINPRGSKIEKKGAWDTKLIGKFTIPIYTPGYATGMGYDTNKLKAAHIYNEAFIDVDMDSQFSNGKTLIDYHSSGTRSSQMARTEGLYLHIPIDILMKYAYMSDSSDDSSMPVCDYIQKSYSNKTTTYSVPGFAATGKNPNNLKYDDYCTNACNPVFIRNGKMTADFVVENFTSNLPGTTFQCYAEAEVGGIMPLPATIRPADRSFSIDFSTMYSSWQEMRYNVNRSDSTYEFGYKYTVSAGDGGPNNPKYYPLQGMDSIYSSNIFTSIKMIVSLSKPKNIMNKHYDGKDITYNFDDINNTSNVDYRIDRGDFIVTLDQLTDSYSSIHTIEFDVVYKE